MRSREDLNHPFRLLPSTPGERGIEDALEELFAGDGHIYLVVGFFTYNGFRSIKDDVAAFLARSPDNRLSLLVGPSSDQFSPRIARDLWALDASGQVSIYKYPRGLHAKLYLRTGSDPYMILGSANLTQVAFRYNLELGMEIAGEAPDDPRIQPYLEWVEEIIATADPMRSRDLLWPIQLWNAAANWGNKARLLPRRHVAKRITPIVILVILAAMLTEVL